MQEVVSNIYIIKSLSFLPEKFHLNIEYILAVFC